MCDICSSILGKYATPHPKTPCPVGKALYCGLCAKYGHSRTKCQRKVCRVGAVTTDTLYPVEIDLTPKNAYIVPDDEACIKAALIVNGGTPMICQEKGKRERREYNENKKRLIALTKSKGQILVLKDEGTAEPDKTGSKSKNETAANSA